MLRKTLDSHICNLLKNKEQPLGATAAKILNTSAQPGHRFYQMGPKIDEKRGFTLLEFIVVLLVGGIMTAMVFPYFGKTMSESSTPIFQVQSTFGLAGVLENVTAEYNASDKSATALTTLRNNINSFDQGDFSVTAEFITVDSGNGNEPLTLQVTVTNQVNNEELWALFTEQ